MTLPSRIPIFPLPGTVLFPGVLLPLHIFEPRYRDLVEDLSNGKWAALVGVVLMDPRDPSRTFPVGCAGRLCRREPLPDGRSNVVFQGVREFALVSEIVAEDTAYGTASVEWWESDATIHPARRDRLLEVAREFFSAMTTSTVTGDVLGDEILVNILAYGLPLSPVERQGLLEAGRLDRRAERLEQTLEFRRHDSAGSTGTIKH